MPDAEILGQIVLPAFATLFVAIDPIGLMPMFLALTPGLDAAARRRVAAKAIATAAVLLVIFALLGETVLTFLGIGMPAFRIAGGLLLFLLAVEMLFERRSERRNKSVESAGSDETTSAEDVAVFPLGVPLIAGPGAIAAVILLMSGSSGDIAGQAAVVGVLLGVLALTGICFLLAERFGRLAGPTFTRAITRVLGMILAALAVQFVLTGLANSGLL